MIKVTWIEDVLVEEVHPVDTNGNPIFESDGITPSVAWFETGLGTGVVTGINRGPVEGESLLDAAVTEFTLGYDPDKYEVIDKVLNPKPQEDLDAIDEAKELEAFKAAEEVEIREAYAVDSEAPVEVTILEGSFIFNGGQDSASYISGAITLAQALGELTVSITDVDNIKIELSFDSANTVAMSVAKQYRDAFFVKQDALVTLANLGVATVIE